MKTILTLMLLAAMLQSTAQGVFSNQTTAALQKVIQDYPHRFSNIKGDRLQERNRLVEYASKVNIPGASHCVIIQDNTAATAFSWTCELFNTTDHEKAIARYQELFNQIRNTIIRIEGEKPFILNGEYEKPGANDTTATIRFRFVPVFESIRRLQVTLTLQEQDEWTIVLRVFEIPPAETAKLTR